MVSLSIAPRIRRQQAFMFTEFTHLLLLVSADSQVRPGLSGAQQREASLAILR